MCTQWRLLLANYIICYVYKKLNIWDLRLQQLSMAHRSHPKGGAYVSMHKVSQSRIWRGGPKERSSLSNAADMARNLTKMITPCFQKYFLKFQATTSLSSLPNSLTLSSFAGSSSPTSTVQSSIGRPLLYLLPPSWWSHPTSLLELPCKFWWFPSLCHQQWPLFLNFRLIHLTVQSVFPLRYQISISINISKSKLLFSLPSRPSHGQLCLIKVKLHPTRCISQNT